MADAAAFESPVVRNYPTSEGGNLTLTDASATAKWLVRADADGPTADRLGARFGSSQMAPGGALVLGSRPGEWIIVGTPGEVSAAVADLDGLEAQEFMTVLDWTHSRAMFRATGVSATRMLEKVCGIDWSDHMTPDSAVLSASVALTTCDLARNDVDGTPSYLIFCDRSVGQYLFDALIDAGNEFGLTVTASSAS
ncbi:MAG: hypothetical protein F4117_12400 [Acidimicrobiales bacterium]|nr:hypothetical protein [Acidimicrobiales bacterium]MYB82710.1 hypothetical protein [Acidimicrobiales bacterium]MYI13347.1 hypothetical protein [Acidimicrobiales bacterium]